MHPLALGLGLDLTSLQLHLIYSLPGFLLRNRSLVSSSILCYSHPPASGCHTFYSPTIVPSRRGYDVDLPRLTSCLLRDGRTGRTSQLPRHSEQLCYYYHYYYERHYIITRTIESCPSGLQICTEFAFPTTSRQPVPCELGFHQFSRHHGFSCVFPCFPR